MLNPSPFQKETAMKEYPNFRITVELVEAFVETVAQLLSLLSSALFLPFYSISFQRY